MVWVQEVISVLFSRVGTSFHVSPLPLKSLAYKLVKLPQFPLWWRKRVEHVGIEVLAPVTVRGTYLLRHCIFQENFTDV
jgi:hypothetical protein